MDQPQDLGSRGSNSGWFRAINTSIRSKLLLGLFVVAVIPLVAMGAAVYVSAEQAMMAKSAAQLEAMRTIKADQLQQHFQTLENQISAFAENRMIVDAMRDFRVSFRTAIEESEVTSDELDDRRKQLRTFYVNDFSEAYRQRYPDKSPAVGSLFDALDD